jgi:hypothetical protein
MLLSAEDQDKVREWLQSKCGQFRCLCCGLGKWQIGLAGVLLGFDLHTTRFFYHGGTPMVSLICTNCGNTLLLHSGVMGFKPDEPPVVNVGEPAAAPAIEKASAAADPVKT